VYLALKRYAEAEQLLKEVTAYYLDNCQEHALLLKTLESLIEALSNSGKQAEADEYKAQSNALKAKLQKDL